LRGSPNPHDLLARRLGPRSQTVLSFPCGEFRLAGVLDFTEPPAIRVGARNESLVHEPAVFLAAPV